VMLRIGKVAAFAVTIPCRHRNIPSVGFFRKIRGFGRHLFRSDS
jgi:hypothetical protein